MSDVKRRTALVEANFAAVAGQLGAGHDGGRLELDAREILGATARLVGAQLGDIETDTSIALTQLYVEQGTRDDFKVVGTKKSLARLIYGTDRIGGKNVAQIHKALVSLFRMELQFRGYDAAAGHSKMIYARLLTRLVFDEQINLLRDDPGRYDPSIMGRRWKGTVEVSLDEWFASQIRAGYWVSLDWESCARWAAPQRRCGCC